jgi:cyclopropane-fatty-acyl-phospholipid synthase
MTPIEACERGLVPDWLVRAGIRRLIGRRLAREGGRDAENAHAHFRDMIAALASGPIAESTEKANDQHYELPPRFFEMILGTQRKYSAAWWPDGIGDLDAAEAAMLQLSCDRAKLANGQRILELGCGWGALTLWMASHYPSSRIAAVSNSNRQREYIMDQARERGLPNVEVITADINDFDTELRFDRVVSLEMFEHMRNYRALMDRIAGWLEPDGRLFVHIFCHREFSYPFQDEGQYDWMARNFFTGGIMPAADTLLYFQENLILEEDWRFSGKHYEQTANAWLASMDRHRDEIMPIMEQVYGKRAAALWFQRWRMFFMACAELFGYRDGNEWLVAHYRFAPRHGSTPA